ncbi:aminopeptidase N [Arcanobacterium pluranimalium]|uniref:aminopeptidase N n=1 Tax=Arcanobacterium pluranimalium TaxID=108028 RepID=UPI00195DDC0B|nr:aminopeptidase N [Arcanobacterium pluranimalium]
MPGENLTRVEAAERAELIQTHSYRVELNLTESDTFTSRSTINFSATAGCSTFVDLIAESVESITLNGVDVPVEYYADSRIALADLAEENELVIAATCKYSHTGEGLHRAIDPADGQAYLYSQFEVPDSRRMFAVFEQPDLKANFTFVVTAPEQWNVFSVSPTPAPQSNGDGTATWEFTPTETISSYLTCIVAGPYKGVEGQYTSVDGRTIPMGVYVRESLFEYLDGEEIIDITKAGMPFFEEAFAQPYPFRKYDQIFVPEYNAGAMEHPGCVTILDDYVFRSRPSEAIVERRAITVLHELAHMWFGDLVTMKWWDDLWLNESFAEYMSHVATAQTTRWTDAWVTFNSSEKSWAQAQDQLPSTHPIAADIRDLEDVMVNFDGITYGKGASVFQQLVAYVGWDGFITGVQKYLAKKAWGNATLNDLLVELEAASGRDLHEWSRLWLEESGINILKPEIVDDGGKLVSFSIRQESDGRSSLRPHRICVGGYNIVDGRYQKVAHAELDIAGELTEVKEFAGIERPELILINDGDFAYAKVRLDEVSLRNAVQNIDLFTDRLTRTLVLFSAWDMCRDGEMPATDFARLILTALETEDHGTVLRTILNQLATATNLYSAPDSRTELQLEVATHLAEIAAATEPGSDRQLQITTSAVALAHTDAQLDAIAGWLDGVDVPSGLVMDNAMRWAVIQRLAAAGRVSEDDVERERTERDNTASGAVAAARARAAIADPAAKLRAWNDLTGGEVPNSVQRGLALGFSGGDGALLVPFVEKYFASVEQQWAERTKEIASNMISYSFPTKLAGRTDLGIDIIEYGTIWLEEHKSSAPAMLRLVSEALDGARRARNAQECDAQR